MKFYPYLGSKPGKQQRPHGKRLSDALILKGERRGDLGKSGRQVIPAGHEQRNDNPNFKTS